MVQILTGEKGEGKTKKLIELANTHVKNAHGNVVFIDSNKRHMYDLNYNIRFIETSNFPLSNYRELIGFIYGVLSQDNDIEIIYIDGLLKIVNKMDSDDIVKLVNKLRSLSEDNNLNFVIGANILNEDIPDEIKDCIMK